MPFRRGVGYRCLPQSVTVEETKKIIIAKKMNNIVDMET